MAAEKAAAEIAALLQPPSLPPQPPAAPPSGPEPQAPPLTPAVPHLIVDTDLSIDVDDVGAFCAMHVLLDRGEAELLVSAAVRSCHAH